jgi:hypothetical protein
MSNIAKLALASTLAMTAKTATLTTKFDGEKDFLSYQAKHGKNYQTLAEYEMRRQLWQATDSFIKSKKDKPYSLAHNKFSDWTADEKQKLLGFKPYKTSKKQVHPRRHSDSNLEAFWIFGSCEPGQYKHWLLGCRDCATGCDVCSGRFIGGSKCKSCPEGVIDTENKCVSCDADQYLILNDDGNTCGSCADTEHCTACIDGTG